MSAYPYRAGWKYWKADRVGQCDFEGTHWDQLAEMAQDRGREPGMKPEFPHSQATRIPRHASWEYWVHCRGTESHFGRSRLDCYRRADLRLVCCCPDWPEEPERRVLRVDWSLGL